jgi:hypothetical protein
MDEKTVKHMLGLPAGRKSLNGFREPPIVPATTYIA